MKKKNGSLLFCLLTLDSIKFDDQGIVIDDGPSQPVPEKFVAAKYSSGKVVHTENSHLFIKILFVNNLANPLHL